MDTTDFGASGIDNPWDEMDISIDDVPISPTTQPSPLSTTPRTPASGNGSTKGKRAAANVEPSPFSLITELISAISSNGPGSGSSNNDNTMFVVMNILDKMLDTNEIEESFYYLVVKVSEGADQFNYKTTFLRMDERRRLGFLKMLIGLWSYFFDAIQVMAIFFMAEAGGGYGGGNENGVVWRWCFKHGGDEYLSFY
ncbi:hypothetical protein GIB67_022961 [Kingdonia uniflora]|uniref:Uncharacterized protein n=1 Tax=Kingdonia uniflora TaxID=39325 RepID=A0A7J7P2Y2_9MAGN|nr:hypothetical protein GIB67_022961 [Kingdonia uniflora]